MAQHIPLALSLLQAVAAQYPGLQKSQPSAPAATVPVNAPPPPPVVQPRRQATNPAPAPASRRPRAQPVPGSNNSSNQTLPQSNSSSRLCDQCHQRPKFVDQNITHPFCSKTCAATAKAAKASSNAGSAVPAPNAAVAASTNITSAVPGNCDFCHQRPKHNDGTKIHPYCGKGCAANAAKQNPSPANGQASGVCQAHGCQKPVYNGTGDFCSLAHKTLAESACLMCRKVAKQPTSHFCSQNCTDEAEKKGPMILNVPAIHETFKSVSDQFKASWRHTGTPCPEVKRIYKILAPQASLASYNAYKATVEAAGQFVAAGRSEGNENRRWHGTGRQCLLGDKGHSQFCASTSCSLCSIVKTSFDISLWGKKTGWGRFGQGIYTSSTSSKANDYSRNGTKSQLKAILLNKVVVGKGCKMTQDNVTLTAPPAGYHSVLAERGGSLNYDELVVYTNDAIRPSFLVLYEA